MDPNNNVHDEPNLTSFIGCEPHNIIYSTYYYMYIQGNVKGKLRELKKNLVLYSSTPYIFHLGSSITISLSTVLSTFLVSDGYGVLYLYCIL
jgi:hypothetical protein